MKNLAEKKSTVESVTDKEVYDVMSSGYIKSLNTVYPDIKVLLLFRDSFTRFYVQITEVCAVQFSSVLGFTENTKRPT